MKTQIATAAFLSAILLCGCQEKKPTVSAEIPNDVKVSAPIVANIERKGTYSAKAAASEDVEIRTRVGGYLDEVKFKKGAKVKKGDILFKIDERPYAAALAAAEAAVKAVESKIALAQSNAERARGLLKKNAISQEAYQARETELLVAKAKLLEAKAAEKNARLNYEFTNVTAPVSGKVGENFVDTGNLVAAHATKLARIVDDSSVKIYFELNTADAVRYKNSGMLKNIDEGNGACVEFKMKGDGKSRKGKLCYYENALAAGTSSLVVRADIENGDGSLMAGSYGDITVHEGAVKNALLVPEEVIGTDLTGRFVLTLNEDDTVRQTPVKLGVSVGNFRVVETGLSKDSRIVVKGLQRATVGRKVNPQNTPLKLPNAK